MAKNTMVLKHYVDVVKEYVAAGAITPGHLIELASTGKVQVHSSAGGFAQKIFAFENELEGEGLANALAAGDRVQCYYMRAGDEVYALLKDGENVSIGDKLVSAGDGTLQKAAVDSSGTVVEETIVAIALEAVDLSASANTAAGRIKVEIV